MSPAVLSRRLTLHIVCLKTPEVGLVLDSVRTLVMQTGQTERWQQHQLHKLCRCEPDIKLLLFLNLKDKTKEKIMTWHLDSETV